MSKADPMIQKFMTTDPVSVEASASLKDAQELMKKKEIRHLPVMKSGSVMGILSDRDIKLVMGFDKVDASKLSVEDICQKKPYTVSPDARLQAVADEMAEKHYGSAIVVQNNRLVGIFTTVDACRALSEILQMRYHEK